MNNDKGHNHSSPYIREEYETLSLQNQELTLRLHEKEIELKALKASLRKDFKEKEKRWWKEKEEDRVSETVTPVTDATTTEVTPQALSQQQQSFVSDLSADSVRRYSRQLLLSDGFGIEGQKKLESSSVLVVGAGGLASTLLLYLAATGISHITILDPDTVELSNLHRQIIHSDPSTTTNTTSHYDDNPSCGRPKPKAISAAEAIYALNPTIQCTPIVGALDWDNALEIVEGHDVVIDASDNPRTRYLLNDACFLAQKKNGGDGGGGGGERGVPLVSGSAMGTEGQLTLYHVRPEHGCYRCMYPVSPNRSDGCKSCSDNGVLGTVPGLIGILQATEVVKLLTGVGETMEKYLVMYDALSCRFVRFKKRGRREDCVLCGKGEKKIMSMEDSRDSLVRIRGPAPVAVPLDSNCVRCDEGTDGNKTTPSRPKNTTSQSATSATADINTISCQEYHQLRQRGDQHILLDVRDERQYNMCSLEGAVNVPLGRLVEEVATAEGDDSSRNSVVGNLSGGTKPVYCICRRGVASVKATRILMGQQSEKKIHSVYNIVGGLNSWAREVDPLFPSY